MNILDSFKNEYLFWMNILDFKKINIWFEFWFSFEWILNWISFSTNSMNIQNMPTIATQ